MVQGSWSARWTAAVLAGLVSVTLASAQEAETPAEERCLECHSEEVVKELPTTFGDGVEVSPFIDKDGFLKSAHGHLACGACHRRFEPTEHPGRKLPSRRQYAVEMNQECERCHQTPHKSEVKQIAAVLHSRGTDKTPLCGDCHNPHAMEKEAHGLALSRNCAQCHEQLYAGFAASVHGGALRDAANHDVPVCTSCHVGHVGGGKSLAAQRVRRGSPCLGCHRDKQLMRKYDLSTNVVSSYLKDFHGVSVKFYGQDDHDIGQRQLVCADCHGTHDIKSASGTAAVAMKANLLGTCRKCHPDATANFPDAWLSHYEPSLARNPLVFLVKMGYWVLIPFVIGGLLIHIVLDIVDFLLRRRRAVHSKGDTPSAVPVLSSEAVPQVPRSFVRFSLRQRVEHLIAMATFGLLVITGLPQMFNGAAWAETTVRVLGGIDLVRLVHRATGYTFAVAVVCHVLIVVAGFVFKKYPLSMLPIKKDFRDAIGSLKYCLGLTDSYPKSDRYDFRQKFEYWGMVLGSVVIAGSGFVLLYPTWFAHYLPGQFIAAAKVAHSYEAILALLTIIVWHMYGARFDPCIFTGKISSQRLAHHHPLEYERFIRLAQTADTVINSDSPSPKSILSRLSSLIRRRKRGAHVPS